jgi:radical SAM protein with 4Fe4S-binding SPASM domain
MASLEITTMVGCPLMCTFCPQAGLKAAYQPDRGNKYLTFENFKAVLDKVPRHVRIDFSGMSEPWANDECTDMLRHALENGRRVAVYTTLYGMSESDSVVVAALLEKYRSQIDVLCLHLPDSTSNMKGWKYSEEWERVFLRFKRFVDDRFFKSVSMMTMDGSGQIHPRLSHLKIRLGKWHGHTRAGSLDESNVGDQKLVESPRHELPVTCHSTPFYDNNVLLPNGDVVICCMDYNLKHVIGNLLQQDYYDIWNNTAFLKLADTNRRQGFSNESICKSCTVAQTHDAIFRPKQKSTASRLFKAVRNSFMRA